MLSRNIGCECEDLTLLSVPITVFRMTPAVCWMVLTFHSNLLHTCSGQNGLQKSSGTPVSIYKITRCHIPEDRNSKGGSSPVTSNEVN
jgi:hypothetical protein